MTTNELRILQIIWDWGGEVSVNIIAKEAGISINYAKVLCESLERENYINFLHSKLAKIKRKGKLQLIRRKIKSPSKIAVNESSLGFLGRTKKGRIMINY